MNPRILIILAGAIILIAGCVQPPACGNGVCDSDETYETCPADCAAPGPVCGNGVCETGETNANCAADCAAPGPVCGNSICESGETNANCAADCAAPVEPVCGNGICETGETNANCAADCGVAEICNDDADNDLDGATDCGDQDCYYDESCAPALADLYIYEVRFPETMLKSITQTITAEVCNSGATLNKSFNTSFYVASTTYPVGAARKIGLIETGGTLAFRRCKNISIDWIPDAIGYHYFTITADSGNAVGEAVEDNNVYTGAQTVYEATLLCDIEVGMVDEVNITSGDRCQIVDKERVTGRVGSKTSLSREEEDYVIINEIPFFFERVDIGMFGYDRYVPVFRLRNSEGEEIFGTYVFGYGEISKFTHGNVSCDVKIVSAGQVDLPNSATCDAIQKSIMTGKISEQREVSIAGVYRVVTVYFAKMKVGEWAIIEGQAAQFVRMETETTAGEIKYTPVFEINGEEVKNDFVSLGESVAIGYK